MEVSCGGGQGPEGAVAPYMDGGVLWGRPRPGRGCSAKYGMEVSCEGGQGPEGAVVPNME
jgi:hypothetical protein